MKKTVLMLAAFCTFLFAGQPVFGATEITEAMISVADVTYTGEAQEPEVTVVDGETTLVENTDYTIDSWSDNQNAGTATVTVSGIGDYSGTVQKSFEIKKAELADVSVKQKEMLTYNAAPQSAEVTTGATAVGGQTVAFTYSAEEGGTYTDAVPSFTDAATYTVYYRAEAANHNATDGQFTVTVGNAELADVSVAQKEMLTYNAGPQSAEVTTNATAVGEQPVAFTYSD
ncbi:MAG: hypothetical protein J6Z49_08445, partial [Kiritimatiellae bacterium]|nr:hypothetical protein [Kiritimatiellia bacterium]